tara:strand:- start:66 stop:344 length:279 start_codon:yes stop_codon:yes gene_type:complete
MTTLSIIIPCYNEHKTILKLLSLVRNCKVDDIEIILVDDFSTDGTRQILRQLKDEDLKLIFHDKNMGKGAALRNGFAIATGKVCIVQDADLE